jgi:hypothetical protein
VTCHYCGAAGRLTRDHVIPLAAGGSTHGWNIVSSCAACNTAKGCSWPTCRCPFCVAAARRFLADITATRPEVEVAAIAVVLGLGAGGPASP